MRTLKERYLNDSKFYALVSLMVSHIDACNYTPSEMREAAMLASIIHEEHQLSINPSILNYEMEKALRIIEKELNREAKKTKAVEITRDGLSTL